jgi:hypothetical protein
MNCTTANPEAKMIELVILEKLLGDWLGRAFTAVVALKTIEV